MKNTSKTVTVIKGVADNLKDVLDQKTAKALVSSLRPQVNGIEGGLDEEGEVRDELQGQGFEEEVGDT